MKKAIVLLSLVGCLCAVALATKRHHTFSQLHHALSPANLQAAWAQFQSHHKRRFDSTTESARRYAIFAHNMHHVRKHQQAFQAGNSTFTVRINRFADLTPDEIAARNGFNMTAHNVLYREREQHNGKHRRRHRRDAGDDQQQQQLPAEFNWVPQGAVGPVVDQGQCGACWAFSAAAALEGLHFRQTGALPSPLSTQQMIDCSSSDYLMGCNGGVMSEAFQYVRQAGGLVASSSYPYEGAQQSCQLEGNMAKLETESSYQTVTPNDADALMAALVANGPISIAIDGGQDSLQFYNGGIYSDRQCGQPNHAVLLVGYGTDTETGLDYWLVKNSWGASWGENGYVRIERNADGDGSCCVTCLGVYPTA